MCPWFTTKKCFKKHTWPTNNIVNIITENFLCIKYEKQKLRDKNLYINIIKIKMNTILVYNSERIDNKTISAMVNKYYSYLQFIK